MIYSGQIVFLSSSFELRPQRATRFVFEMACTRTRTNGQEGKMELQKRIVELRRTKDVTAEIHDGDV